MKKELIRKIKSSYGETLTETLVALLIGALALVMIPGAIVAAAKANKAASDATVYQIDNGSSTSINVTLDIGGYAETVECDRMEYMVNGQSRKLYYYDVH